ncbi:MAG: hypothetical protein J6C26_09510 [Clostridia bacterium]|nr:hypothetical protein [Clostridia bacterium]
MTEKDLFKLLGDLPDEMILEADPANFKKKKSPVAWIKYASAAVAAALVIALSITFLPLGTGTPSVDLPTTDRPPLHTQGSQPNSSPSGDERPDTNITDTDHETDTEDDNSTHGEIKDNVYWQEGKVPETQVFLTSDALTEMYYSIPFGAWNVAVYDDLLTWENVLSYGNIVNNRMIEILYRDGDLDPNTPVIPGNWYDSSYPRIPSDKIRDAYLEAWGPFFWEAKLKSIENGSPLNPKNEKGYPNSIGSDNCILFYEEATDSYIVYNEPPMDRGALKSGDHFYGRLLYTEEINGELVAYIRFGNYDILNGKCYLLPTNVEHWFDKDNPIVPLLEGDHSSNYKEDKNSIYNRLFAGMFDEYLPVYRLSFRPDSEGKYWWSSTQRVKESQPIPAELATSPIPETRPAGTVLPIYGAADEESSVKLGQLSYFRPYMGIYQFCITLEEDRLDYYCKVPGNDEVLTKKDYILTFQQNLDGETCTWEVYSSNEYPNGFGIILVNVTKGTSENWYRLER